MSKISIKNLDLYYGDFKALKNINLEIEENKITAFIGPSGCGKSTLLKSINRMNDLVEGCRYHCQGRNTACRIVLSSDPAGYSSAGWQWSGTLQSAAENQRCAGDLSDSK